MLSEDWGFKGGSASSCHASPSPWPLFWKQQARGMSPGLGRRPTDAPRAQPGHLCSQLSLSLSLRGLPLSCLPTIGSAGPHCSAACGALALLSGALSPQSHFSEQQLCPQQQLRHRPRPLLCVSESEPERPTPWPQEETLAWVCSQLLCVKSEEIRRRLPQASCIGSAAIGAHCFRH